MTLQLKDVRTVVCADCDARFHRDDYQSSGQWVAIMMRHRTDKDHAMLWPEGVDV